MVVPTIMMVDSTKNRLEPPLIQPQLIQPRLIQSQLNQPKRGWDPALIQPQLIQPRLIQSQLNQPKRGWDPALIQPHLIQPRLNQPQLIQPKHSWINRDWSPVESTSNQPRMNQQALTSWFSVESTAEKGMGPRIDSTGHSTAKNDWFNCISMAQTFPTRCSGE